MSKLLAIDPGTTKSGWCYIEDSEPIDWGWTDNGKMYALINKFQSPLAIEDIAHYGMPVGRDVFDSALDWSLRPARRGFGIDGDVCNSSRCEAGSVRLA